MPTGGVLNGNGVATWVAKCQVGICQDGTCRHGKLSCCGAGNGDTCEVKVVAGVNAVYTGDAQIDLRDMCLG